MAGRLARRSAGREPPDAKNLGSFARLATIEPVFRPFRSLLSVALLLGGLWAMFSVDLGGMTFAEHMDTISETPQAQQLVEGTRERVNPALGELRDRLLGEYVEAPTWIPAEDSSTTDGLGSELFPASTLEPGANFEPSLPGRRSSATPEPDTLQPALPGQRSTAILEPDTLQPALPGRATAILEPEAGLEPALPGRRAPTALDLDFDAGLEPALPGRRRAPGPSSR